MTMHKARTGLLTAMLVGLGVLGLAGCGGDNPTATPVVPTATTGTAVEATSTTAAMDEPTATTAAMEEATATTGTGSSTGSGDAMDVLTQAGTAMKGVKSYHMTMQVEASGANSTIEADVEPPDKYRMNVDAGGGIMTEVIIVGGSSYSKVPGSDQYIEAPMDASLLAQSDASDIADVAQNATVVGDETVNGVSTTHVSYTVAADTTGTTGAETKADVWVDKSTGYIQQYKIVADASGTSSTTTITYSKFNETISPPIEKPANIMSIPTVPSP